MANHRIDTIVGESLHAAQPPRPAGSPIVLLAGTAYGGDRSAVALDAEAMGRHVLFAGPSGCGKTNCIREALRQVISAMGPEDSLIVFDPKGDYRPLMRPCDHAVSVTGSTEPWNLFGEINVDGDDEETLRLNAGEVADTVFREEIVRSSQPFFPRAARGVFADIAATMAFIASKDRGFRREKLNNAELMRFITMLDADRLEILLANSPYRGSLKFVGDGSSDQALGVLAELQEVAERLFAGTFGGKGILSARRLLRKGGMGLFIEYDIAKGSSPAYRAIIDMALKEALSATPRRGSVYVFLDELPLLPHLGFLPNALAFGRSKGVKVVAGIQGIGQLLDLYGDHGGRSLAAGFQSIFAFRSTDAATREYVSGLSGRCLKEVTYLSGQTGRWEGGMREGHAVEDADLLALGLGEAACFMPGGGPFAFRFDEYQG